MKASKALYRKFISMRPLALSGFLFSISCSHRNSVSTLPNSKTQLPNSKPQISTGTNANQPPAVAPKLLEIISTDAPEGLVVQLIDGSSVTFSKGGTYDISKTGLLAKESKVEFVPPGFACSLSQVDSGQGLKLTLSCTRLTYKVVGSAEGLDGTVNLSLRGAQPLSLNLNGTFEFTQKVEFGSVPTVDLTSAILASKNKKTSV